jgi:hypothetical protein
MTQHSGLPVAGYRPQSEEAVARVNACKLVEESVLRILDELAERDDVDKRWLSVGRTHLEQGFMAINRSIFRPDRIALD